jgi:nucleoside-diphosphate-sugar epimerase
MTCGRCRARKRLTRRSRRWALRRCAAIWSNVAAEHIGDAEAIIHCAAFVEQWGPRDAWRKFNIDGTRRTLGAARGAGAKRFIHISTESVLWRGQHLRGVDETYPRAPNSPYPYSSTKARAEELVEQANTPAFQTIILRPRFHLGAGRYDVAADHPPHGKDRPMDVDR